MPQLFMLELAGLGIKPTDAGFDSTYCHESESSPESMRGKLCLEDGEADATEAMVTMGFAQEVNVERRNPITRLLINRAWSPRFKL